MSLGQSQGQRPHLQFVHRHLIFIRHGGTGKLFGTNNHQDKTMCLVQEQCCYVKRQVHSSHLQFMHRLK